MFWEHLQSHFIEIFNSRESRFSWYFWIISYACAFAYYWFFRKGKNFTFFKDTFALKNFLNLSTYVDMVIFTISGFYLLDFFFNVNPGKVYDISRGFFLIKEQGIYPWLNDSILFQIFWTAFRVVIGDFGYYIYHWLMHNIKSLWFFHAVHHSARSLNFLTAYRLHPVDGFMSNLILGIAGGIFAFISMILVGKESVRYVIYGFVFYMPARAVIANLRHSQVWMRFPKWLSTLVMSPAQHQIHHSRDLKYFNKNFSNDFAFIDLVFGTLYVPTENDYNELVVGIDEEEHKLDPGSVWSCHIQPFINLYHYWKEKLASQKTLDL